jgi:hypothetical protein
MLHRTEINRKMTMNDKDLEGGAQELLEDTDPLTDWSD